MELIPMIRTKEEKTLSVRQEIYLKKKRNPHKLASVMTNESSAMTGVRDGLLRKLMKNCVAMLIRATV